MSNEPTQIQEEDNTPKADYRWVITRDLYWEYQIKNGETDFSSPTKMPRCDVGPEGPWNVDSTMKLTKCFRMYVMDMDKIDFIYEGWATPEADFNPLDDFGRPNFGCEGIVYWNEIQCTWDHL